MSFTNLFPPKYEWIIWDFSWANVNGMSQAVNFADWDRTFNNSNIDEVMKFLTKCGLNFFYNFIPSKVITIRSNDTLQMAPGIKTIILEKAKIYECYVKHG